MRPDDEKARNLLGLACFKIGDHDRALKIYDGLVDQNPTDPTLRVNLGLVHLKSGRFEDAIRELSAAVDLQPDHRRAQNYLGLAYARVGDYAQARECFAAAGSEQMVERMDKALAGEPYQGQAASSGPAFSAIAEPPGEAGADGEDAEIAVEDVAGSADDAFAAEAGAGADGADTFAADVEDEVEVDDEAVLVEVDLTDIPAAEGEIDPFPAAATVETSAADRAATWAQARPLIAEARALAVAAPETGVFAVGTHLVVCRVEGQLLSRVQGLVAAEGNLAFAPEVKRFRGRATDKPFGEGAGRVLRVTGDGRLLLARGGATFSALEIDGVDGYFQEEAVFAFDEDVIYENGRVPSSVSPDLNLVHLRGAGAVLVRTAGEMVTMRLEPDRSMRVPMPRLVGWHGGITPRLAAFADEGGEDGGPLVGVELTGEGVVLVSLPPGED